MPSPRSKNRSTPPNYRQRAFDEGRDEDKDGDPTPDKSALDSGSSAKLEVLFEGHKEFQENQRGVSYDRLFLPYLRGAIEITITDPYIRRFHQVRNLMELIEGIAAGKDPADEVVVRLVTSEDIDGDEFPRKQIELLDKVRQGAAAGGVNVEVSFDSSIHDRSIVTDTGWKILLGRGLDIFQYVAGDAFDLASRLQEYRQVRAFGVTYMRMEA